MYTMSVERPRANPIPVCYPRPHPDTASSPQFCRHCQLMPHTAGSFHGVHSGAAAGRRLVRGRRAIHSEPDARGGPGGPLGRADCRCNRPRGVRVPLPLSACLSLRASLRCHVCGVVQSYAGCKCRRSVRHQSGHLRVHLSARASGLWCPKRCYQVGVIIGQF